MSEPVIPAALTEKEGASKEVPSDDYLTVANEESRRLAELRLKAREQYQKVRKPKSLPELFEYIESLEARITALEKGPKTVPSRSK